MKTLEAVNKHWPVFLFEDISADFNDVVGPDTDQVRIKGRMMQCALGNAVANGWQPQRVRVGHDVSCLEQFLTSKAANCTVVLIRADDALPEFALMQPLTKEPRCVTAPDLRFV